MATPKTKFNWKPGAIAAGVLAALFILLAVVVRSNKSFKVVHFAEVQSTVGADGRAAVGSPEVYQVQISPSLAWTEGSSSAKTWRVIAWVVLLLAAVYIFLVHTDRIDVGKSGNTWLFVILGIALGCYLGAFSSAFVSNYVELSADQYRAVEGNKEALSALFTNKELIR